MGHISSVLESYLAQTVLHSLVILLLVEGALRVWRIELPEQRFRFRLLTLLLPPLMFPLFQLLHPERGSFYFVEDRALFSTASWLQLELLDGIRLGTLFYLFLAVVSVLTVRQEFLPILRHWLASGRADRQKGTADGGSELHRRVVRLSRLYRIKPPSIAIMHHSAPALLVNEGKGYRILISDSLLEQLLPDELDSALAHELAHVVRRSSTTTTWIFLLRALLFYNPISLLVFRRLIQDDEQICDDLTVSITGNPEALASALEKFYLKLPPKGRFSLAASRESLSLSSHNLLIRERVERLLKGEGGAPAGFPLFPFILTAGAAVIVCFGVV